MQQNQLKNLNKIESAYQVNGTKENLLEKPNKNRNLLRFEKVYSKQDVLMIPSHNANRMPSQIDILENSLSQNNFNIIESKISAQNCVGKNDRMVKKTKSKINPVTKQSYFFQPSKAIYKCQEGNEEGMS